MPTSPLVRAVQSLHFQQDRRAELNAIHPRQWPALLKLTDRFQITLPLGIRCRDYLPDTVQRRVDQNLDDNAVRHELIGAEYKLIDDTLRARGIEFIVLKGLSQIAPLYVADVKYRPQYDIDLYCPPASIDSARDALIGAGFQPLFSDGNHTDHVPPLIRNPDWKWRGNYYAPDLPLTVELHFRFWDPQTERLHESCVDQFWRRRCNRNIGGHELPMLCLTDSVSYSALHLMRHLLRGDLKIYHVYELAHFLHQTEHNDELWQKWAADRSEKPAIVETVAFHLAHIWFGCKAHPIVQEKVQCLPAKILRWFELFSLSPLAPERPNKDELFLHLSLLEHAGNRRSVVARRLAPRLPAGLVVPKSATAKHSLRVALNSDLRNACFVAARAAHHVRTMVNLIPGFYRWKFSGRKHVV